MVEELDKVIVGKRIRTARDSLNMSRDRLAEQVPMSASFLQDVEGGTKCLSLDKFFRVMQILDVSADYLLYSQGEHMTEDEEKAVIFERMKADMSGCSIEEFRSMAEVIRVMSHAISKKEQDK